MKDWIITLALLAAAFSLAAARITYRTCRETERERNRCILLAIRELDRLGKELEQVRLEKRLLERLLGTGDAVRTGKDRPPEI